MTIADEIEKLNNLRQTGAISEEEYQKAKASLLKQNETMGERANHSGAPINENTWSMLLHLSQFCFFIFPFGGLIAPIVMWQIKKDESPLIDRHGRIVTNWVISEMIYLAVTGILCLLLIGLALLPVVILLGIIFPIIGGVRASKGETWEYPCSIRFFSLD